MNNLNLINVAKIGAVCAGSGLLYTVGKKLIHSSSTSFNFTGLTKEGNELLSQNSVIALLCERLQFFSSCDSHSFQIILTKWAELLELKNQIDGAQQQVKLHNIRKISKHISCIVEAIRVMRANVSSKQNMQMMTEFDDIAASFQNEMDEFQYNLTKTIEWKNCQYNC